MDGLGEECVWRILVDSVASLDLRDRVEKIVQVLDQKHTAKSIVLNPQDYTEDEAAEINDSAEHAEISLPLDEVARSVVVAGREKDLQAEALESIQ